MQWFYYAGLFLLFFLASHFGYFLQFIICKFRNQPKNTTLHVVTHSLSLLVTFQNTSGVLLLPKGLFVGGKIDSVPLSTDGWKHILISEQEMKQECVVVGGSSSVTFMWQVVEESCQFSAQLIWSVTLPVSKHIYRETERKVGEQWLIRTPLYPEYPDANFGTASEFRGHQQRHIKSQMSPWYGTSCCGTDDDLDTYFGMKLLVPTSYLMVTPSAQGI